MYFGVLDEAAIMHAIGIWVVAIWLAAALAWVLRPRDGAWDRPAGIAVGVGIFAAVAMTSPIWQAAGVWMLWTGVSSWVEARTPPGDNRAGW